MKTKKALEIGWLARADYNMSNIAPFTTPIGEVAWAYIFKPSTKFNKNGEYIIDVKFDENEFFGILKNMNSILDEFIEQLISSGEISDSQKSTLIKANIYVKNENKKYTIRGKQYTKNLNSSYHKIPITDSKESTIISLKKEISGGSRVKLKLYPKPYFSSKNNNVGISFRINGIQIISDGYNNDDDRKKVFSAKIDVDLIAKLKKAQARYFEKTHIKLNNDDIIIVGIEKVIDDIYKNKF